MYNHLIQFKYYNLLHDYKYKKGKPTNWPTYLKKEAKLSAIFCTILYYYLFIQL